MLRPCWAAFVAAVVVAAFTLAPAMAGERATLKVSARVVDQCTIEVPPWVSPRLWRDRQDEPWRFVHHRCRDSRPFWVDARKVLLDRLRERLLALRDHDHGQGRGHGRDDPGWGDRGHEARDDRGYDRGHAHEARHPTRDDVVLITITY